jgi:enoyl-CoA hydratase/carnithine racemase
MHECPVRLRIEDGIAFCELCSPPGNVMDTAFFECFQKVRDSFSDHAAAGMVVCSTGRHFSSGASVDGITSMIREQPAATMSALLRKNHRAFESISLLSIPVVAAISGCCLGAGLELALACHYRVSAPSAVFSLPEATFGLMPGCGGTVRLPALVGVGRAIELSLSGRTIGADEALACGLVDMVVEKKALLSTAVRMIGAFRRA